MTFDTSPLAFTPAMPSTPSRRVNSSSSTKEDSATVSYPSRLTAATLTGIRSGLIFMIVGMPTSSLQEPESCVSFSRMASAAYSRSASPVNCRNTTE